MKGWKERPGDPRSWGPAKGKKLAGDDEEDIEVAPHPDPPRTFGCSSANTRVSFSLPARQSRHIGLRGASRNPIWRVLDSQTAQGQNPSMETAASGPTHRANAPEGRKRFPINSPS